MDFNSNNNELAVLTTSSNNIAFLNKTTSGGRFSIAQNNASATSQPTTVSYVGLSQNPVVGFLNGTVMVLTKNSTSGQYYTSQTLATGFTSVGASDAESTRYVICDGSSNRVRVYYWNYTTSTLNGDLAADSFTTGAAATAGCTALDLTTNERFIIFGYNSGGIFSFLRTTSNNTYTSLASLTSNTDSVTDVRVFGGNYAVICTNSGPARILNIPAGGTVSSATTTTAPLTCQSIDVRPQNDEVVVGGRT